MPIIMSAKKALRGSKVKTARNEKNRTKFRQAIKKTLKLIELGEMKLAEQQLRSTYKAVDKAAKSNVIHKNKAANIKSRLTRKVQAKVKKTKKNVKTAPKAS